MELDGSELLRLALAALFALALLLSGQARAADAEPTWGGRLGKTTDETASPYRLSAALAVAGGLALLVDKPIRDHYQSDLRSEATDRLSNGVRGFGDGLVLTGLLGAGYLTGYALDDSRLSNASLTAFASFAIAGAITQGVKLLARRDRPNHTDDPYDFHVPGNSGGKSFVSGHATHAFAAATAIALAYDEDPYVAPVAYSLAGLTALSRVNDNQHWASDALLGSALGAAVATMVHRYAHPEQQRDTRYSVRPMLAGDAAGLSVAIRF